jgi:hypothetical protein
MNAECGMRNAEWQAGATDDVLFTIHHSSFIIWP